jgi:hypothetical protein
VPESHPEVLEKSQDWRTVRYFIGLVLPETIGEQTLEKFKCLNSSPNKLLFHPLKSHSFLLPATVSFLL